MPPRLRSNEPGAASRRASWLELFYDLVYVIVVARLAHALAADVTPHGFAAFVGLFVPVWWSWSGVTFYNDRFDTDDAFHRAFTLLAMAAAAVLALSVQDALHGPAFALAYAALRLLLVAQYLRVALHVPTARALCRRYATGFTIAAAIWVAALALPEPWRYLAWALAMLVDVATPLTARRMQAGLPVSTSHLPERIGLFTILVLGESVAAIVRGASGVSVGALIGIALGLSIAFGVWWVYFDNLEQTSVRRSRLAGQTWFYAHLPLVVGIVAAAVGVEALVEVAPRGTLAIGHRWLLGGGFAIALLALAAIHAATAATSGRDTSRRRASLRATSAVAAVAIALAAGGAAAWLYGGALALIALAQIALDPPSERVVAAA